MPPKKKRKAVASKKKEKKTTTNIDDTTIKLIKEVFDTYAEEDGTISSVKRIKYALQDVLDIKIKREEIRTDFAETSSISLDYTAFLNYASRKLQQKEKSNTAYTLLDKENKGFISIQDIERAVKELGDLELSYEDIEEMMKEADTSDDNEGLFIDRNDLFRMIRKIKL
mmetsp:Transcript_4417/g.5108  ORF Transcript_4417/g.5108 Transcript_4417/m.5108 type:complete len:169 (-) Transcript_4417:100-606(-)